MLNWLVNMHTKLISCFLRIGCGVSDHPDPIQAIQTQTFIEITKVINAMLKAGQIGNQTYDKVVNVGHSYGSIIAAGLMAQYPNSSDGSVLTGFTFSGASVPATVGLHLLSY